MDTRGIILEALLAHEKSGEFADRIIKSTLDKYSYLEKHERSFLKRVFFGTIERKLTLDYIIDLFSTVKVNKQKPVIRNILRMSAYQLMFMEAVPDSAAINEAVKLAKNKKFVQLSGFVNGVLRKLAAEKDNIIYPCRDEDYVNYLSIKYSCPKWICEHFIDEIGLHKTEEVLKYSLKESPLTIRVNLSKISKSSLMRSFEDEGISVRDTADEKSISGLCKSAANAALIIDDIDSLSRLEAFNEGLFTVQDLSSQTVCADIGISGHFGGESYVNQNLDISKAHLIVDVCAAPGGKTCHMADILKCAGSNAVILSRDISQEKINKINENILRCGFDNVKTQVSDALVLDESIINKADIVIADLPCSGLGVIGRKVDIKYRVQPDDLKALSKLQRDILSVVSQYVKPGGMLIYSTCTVDKAENEDNAEWAENNLPLKLCKPYTRILNDNELSDGFFIAVFTKESR